MAQAAQSTLLARIKGWFPDREFIMRSQGQVRFVRISSSLQMKAAGGAAALAVVWSATMGVAVVSEWNTRTNAAELSERVAASCTWRSERAFWRCNWQTFFKRQSQAFVARPKWGTRRALGLFRTADL